MSAVDNLSAQLVWLFVLAAPVACVTWTVTHEDVFAEVRHWCVRKSQTCRGVSARKFFYLFTCEYCFSHYVAAAAVGLTGFTLLVSGWIGALVAWLSLVWVANLYMSLFVRLRLDIKRERVEITMEEGHAGVPRGRERPLDPALSRGGRGDAIRGAPREVKRS
jgi:hypothetical protein